MWLCEQGLDRYKKPERDNRGCIVSYSDNVNTTESYQNIGNLTPPFYSLEMSDIPSTEITTRVQNFINSTKQ